MQRAISTVALTIVLGLGVMASSGGEVRVTVASAQVFLNPNVTSLVLGVVKAGTVLTIDLREKDWVRIVLPSADGTKRIGYIRQADIQFLDGSKAPAPASVPTAAPQRNAVSTPGPASSWTALAIEEGHTHAVAPVRLGSRLGLMDKLWKHDKDPGIAFFTTPFLRVALAAADAREKLKSFTAKDIPKWMLEPVVTVYMPHYEATGSEITRTSPEHLVIREAGSSSPDRAVQPLRTRDFDPGRDWLVQVGETRTLDTLVADFPISSLRLGNEFYILVRQNTSGLNSFDSKMKPVTFRITQDMLALGGCPLACK